MVMVKIAIYRDDGFVGWIHSRARARGEIETECDHDVMHGEVSPASAKDISDNIHKILVRSFAKIFLNQKIFWIQKVRHHR